MSESLRKTLYNDVVYLEKRSKSTVKTNRHLIRKKAKEAIQDLNEIAKHVNNKDVRKIFDSMELSKLIYNILLRLDDEKQDKEYLDTMCVAIEEAINAVQRQRGGKGKLYNIKVEYATEHVPDDNVRKKFVSEISIDAI